jgi:hypothetical protein
MPTSSRTSKQPPAAAFVFKGTLKKLRSTTMPIVPVDDQTAIVRVDEILAASDAFADYTGQEITVRLSGEGAYQAGQQLIFHTNSWLYGDSIAVQSVEEEPVADASASRGKAAGGALKGRQAATEPEHWGDADLVVRGKVMEVRLPSEARQSGPQKTGGPLGIGPISEHSPDWREAVVKVTDVVKGESADKEIVVRFPYSTDIRWHQVPKFTPGQEGYFLLHHTEAGEAETERRGRKAGAKADDDTPTYTILHAEDFQP